MHFATRVAGLLATCTAVAARSIAGWSDDVVTLPFPPGPYAPLNATSWSGVVPSTGRSYTGHLGVSHDASLFSVELPPNGCQEHRAVSTVVAELGCELATNGGFFQFTPPACQYNLITDNDVQLWTTDLNFVALGISQTRKRTNVGYIGDASGYEFQSLVSGQGWLVRDGKVYVNSSREFSPKNGFYSEKAPRTGVGLRADGAVMLLVVDGIETEDQGVDLWEFAEIFAGVGAHHAINIDGGGSSDAVLRGQVWSRPTCQDTPTPICERNVTSVTCIRYAQ